MEKEKGETEGERCECGFTALTRKCVQLRVGSHSLSLFHFFYSIGRTIINMSDMQTPSAHSIN